MRISRVTTRTGDGGTTRLAGGQTVPKDDARVAALGSVDELNSSLGVVLACQPEDSVAESLRQIQHDLFELGAEICAREEDKPEPRRGAWPGPEILTRLEEEVARRLEVLGPLREFILPGGSPAAAALHVARSVCRRAERDVVTLGRAEAVGPGVIPYLNRLSDLLFVLARAENRAGGREETLWRRSGGKPTSEGS